MTVYESKQLNTWEDPALVVLCQCHSTEHHAMLSWDDEDRLVYLTVHLAPLRFWRRLWHAVKYVFGKASRYGAYEELVLTHEDAEYLQSWLRTRLLLSGLGRG